MRVYELQDPGRLRLRAHPWVGSDSGPQHHYTDFLLHPELIRTSLEDFDAWREHQHTEIFLQLIEWLHGPESELMSNDCAFDGPAPNEGPHSERRLEASGRLMVLFRDLSQNASAGRVPELTQRVARVLSQTDRSLVDGVVGASIVDVLFTTLPGPPARQRGQQLMLSFWAWGDDESATLRNLQRTLANLAHALRSAGRADHVQRAEHAT